MRKSSKKVEKIYDINKEIQKKCVYQPLRFIKNGKEYIVDYNLNEYCHILTDEAKYATAGTDTKETLMAQIAIELYEDGRKEQAKALKESEELAKKKLKNSGEVAKKDPLDLLNQRFAERIKRVNKRLIEGIKNKNIDGKTKTHVASDSTCYTFLLDLEKKYKISLLIRVNPEVPFYYENKYIYSLVVQLIDVMYTSEIYNYIPNSGNYQCTCYKNHLEMIEKNIEEIFATRKDFREKWKLILRPLKQIICNFNYPGFCEDDIWIQKCEELQFFDCAYEIGKDYNLYQRVKKRLFFDLGDTEEEVKAEIKRSQDFLNRNRQDEKTLFCNKMIDTLRIIVKDEFGL